ncbi:Armadillo-type fold,Armadillo,Armadillo-like helical [Cinara cedri]|uniref:Armadillo-type fold,Armadillo,Armadillo-like helical n=1 Tax=Cinara cedri TaxID=506608 RepID=A0A5E4MYA0_9HEMI|nr:Armadillo-type fold,Armadillo,Armadillo-like helical [Cinara cedri]
MSSHPKVVQQTFEDFAKSQLKFVQNLAELASKSSYAENLYEICAVETVMPLVTCMNPTVRMNAVLTLARLANHSEPSTKQIMCSKNQLQRLFGKIDTENKYYKNNCMSLIKNISKHFSSNTLSLIKEYGGLDAISICLKDFDVNVRESALLAITSITRQDVNIATFIVNSGLLPPIIQCLKEQQQNLKLYALSALAEIAKYNQELALSVVEVKCLPIVIQFLSESFKDGKVQRNALTLIKNIVKHSLFLTETAIESNLFPDLSLLMAHPTESIRSNAAKVIREVVRHSIQIAQMVVNNGGLPALINVIACSQEFSSTPAVLALGFIASMSPVLALSIIKTNKVIINFLFHFVFTGIIPYIHVKASVIWTLGMIGQHSHEHARYIWDCGALTAMIEVFMDPSLENESKHQLKSSIQQILKECEDYKILEKLLMSTSHAEMMEFVLDKISKILPNNSKARRSFITNGQLKRIQNLTPEIDSELYHVIQSVNCSFPEDIVQLVAGDFPEAVMKTVDKYVPKSQCLFYNNEDQIRRSSSSVKKPGLSGEESTTRYE